MFLSYNFLVKLKINNGINITSTEKIRDHLRSEK